MTGINQVKTNGKTTRNGKVITFFRNNTLPITQDSDFSEGIRTGVVPDCLDFLKFLMKGGTPLLEVYDISMKGGGQGYQYQL